MDSDDNMLVIDEWHEDMEDMEVSSTTPNKSLSPVRRNDENISDACENEADSLVTGATVTKEQHSKKKHKDSDKVTPSKKTKEERRKSSTATPNNEKKRPVSKKSYNIRLTDSIIKGKMLNITAQKHQLYNMRFTYRKDLLIAEMPDIYPAPPSFPDLSLAQLLNWPDIKMIIQLNYLTFSREIQQNCERDLVFGDDVTININTDKNVTSTRYLKPPTKSNKPPKMVSKDVFDVYVTSLMEVAKHYDVGPSKLPEIEETFTKILDDVAKIRSSSIQTKMTHSRFMNEYKYYCIFDDDSATSSKDASKAVLREIINPEVNFTLDKCTFTSDLVNVWSSSLSSELEDILLKRSSQAKSNLRERYKKCLSLKCEKCNEEFEGPLWAVKLKDHIKQKHYVAKKWTCVKCSRKWDQFELLQMGWKHNCSTGA